MDCCMTANPPDDLDLSPEQEDESPKRTFPTWAEREARAAARKPREPAPHFDVVPEHQLETHARLENWAKWCRSRGGREVAPGFGLVKADRWDLRGDGRVIAVPVEKNDAARIASEVAVLPEKHRLALHWYYITPVRSPRSAASGLGLTLAGLAQLVIDARQMLINRGA